MLCRPILSPNFNFCTLLEQKHLRVGGYYFPNSIKIGWSPGPIDRSYQQPELFSLMQQERRWKMQILQKTQRNEADLTAPQNSIHSLRTTLCWIIYLPSQLGTDWYFVCGPRPTPLAHCLAVRIPFPHRQAWLGWNKLAEGTHLKALCVSSKPRDASNYQPKATLSSAWRCEVARGEAVECGRLFFLENSSFPALRSCSTRPSFLGSIPLTCYCTLSDIVRLKSRTLSLPINICLKWPVLLELGPLFMVTVLIFFSFLFFLASTFAHPLLRDSLTTLHTFKVYLLRFVGVFALLFSLSVLQSLMPTIKPILILSCLRTRYYLFFSTEW